MTTQMIALMGRRDGPLDGVEDYCVFLTEALAGRGVELKQVRVNWNKDGWLGALRNLWRASAQWCAPSVALQYTALGWSRRGFPFGALAAVGLMRLRGAHCAVVFHEARHQAHGSRLRDRLRARVQDLVIRSLYRLSQAAIFTIPLAKVSWLPAMHAKASFIPIGANIGEISGELERADDKRKKVAVYCFSAGPNRFLELDDLAVAMRQLNDQATRTELIVLGKGSDEMRSEIRQSLEECTVGVSILGTLPAQRVSEVLAGADVLLFVSGHVAQTRGSALAGIACGLPIVGYAGSAAGTPIEEAGLVLVPYRNQQALADALARVLNDDAYRGQLRKRSVLAQQKYFSWSAIATRYVEFLELEERSSRQLDRKARAAENDYEQASG